MILDTSFLLDVMDREPGALARARKLSKDGTEAWMPTPALYELWRGVHLAARTAAEADRVVRLLRLFPIADFDAPAADHAGAVDAHLIRQGASIDPEDVMIAGIALARHMPVLTRNERHFTRIPGLEVITY